jgi:hypothetical protein
MVGRVTAVAWPGQTILATALAEQADRADQFPGIGSLPDRPIRLILADTRARYDSLTRGRMPVWSEGAALPDAGAIVLDCEHPSDCLHGALRHELAHLALAWRVGRALPLWFQEGYAALAAGEWSDLDALQLNWRVAQGALPNLDELDQALRGDRTDAGTAYALAMTAVTLLQRWGGGGPDGLARLIGNLASERGFDAAIRVTYRITEGEFETRWQKDVASRYGWVSWASAVGVFWTVTALLLIWLVRLRRRRDAPRRAALDEGWVIPEEP